MNYFDPYTTLKDMLEKADKELSADLTESKHFNLLKNKQFSQLLNDSPSVVFILNNHSMSYEYFSPNVKDILGYEPKKFLEGGMNFTMSTMDPEHLEIHSRYIYRDVFIKMREEKPKTSLGNLQFTTTFKVRKADGEFLWVMQQFKVIETDEAGDPFLTLVFMHDISNIKKDELVDFLIASKETSNSGFRTIYAACYSGSNKASVFSKRELQVLYYLSKGLSSKKIAEELNLSSHTVNNHRKNMLKKSQSKNSADLLHFAMKKGFVP